MKGKTLEEFIDDLYFCAEMEYIYQGRTYFITAWTESENGWYVLTVYESSKEMPTLFYHTSPSKEECVHLYEIAPIYDGRTIYEAEKEIEVVFG